MKLRPATVRAYHSDLRQAARSLPQDLISITPRDIEEVVIVGEPGHATVARRMSSLKRFFGWCVRHDLCPTNPVARCESVQVKHGLPRPIPRDDRQQLEKAFDALAEPYRTIFWLLRETGMRAGEALNLRIGDIDITPSREMLYIHEAKNGRPRPVHLGDSFTPKTLRRLRRLLKERGNDPHHAPLFRSNRQSQVTYGALLYQWGKLCQSLNLIEDVGHPQYTIHQLRHTRGSELVEQGHSLDIVQQVLGHRDPRSTQIYAELHPTHVRTMLERQ